MHSEEKRKRIQLPQRKHGQENGKSIKDSRPLFFLQPRAMMTENHSKVNVEGPSQQVNDRILIYTVHGWRSNSSDLSALVQLLKDHYAEPSQEGLLVRNEDFKYSSWILSWADPWACAKEIQTHLRRLDAEYHPTKIVIVAHSIGAMLVRWAYLSEAGILPTLLSKPTANGWETKIDRMVLLASPNAGWELVTPSIKPVASTLQNSNPSSTEVDSPGLSFRRWFYRVLKAILNPIPLFGSLILNFEAGSIFVVNLQLATGRLGTNVPKTFYLLGEHDRIVKQEHYVDVASGIGQQYRFFEIPRTGHQSIIEVNPPRKLWRRIREWWKNLRDRSRREEVRHIRNLRKQLFLYAACDKHGETASSYERTLGTPLSKNHVVFLIHGIRTDVQSWEQRLSLVLSAKATALKQEDSIMIVPIQYGRVSILEFLIPRFRRLKLKEVVKTYALSAATYPSERHSFVAHSFGTYIVSRLLADYLTTKLFRIVFAGAIVNQQYDWNSYRTTSRISAVRNDMRNDSIVALTLPTFYQISKSSEIGTAGFEGFLNGLGTEHQNRFSGSHNVDENHAYLDSIADFLLDEALPPKHSPQLPGRLGEAIALNDKLRTTSYIVRYSPIIVVVVLICLLALQISISPYIILSFATITALLLALKIY